MEATKEPEIIIRASSLSDYANCPRKASAKLFREQIEDKGFKLRKRPPHISASLGVAAHAAFAQLLRDKRDRKFNVPIADTIAYGINEFDKEVAGGFETDDTTPNKDTAYKQIQTAIRLYAIRILPKIEPKFIEKLVRYDLGDGFILEGHLDAYDYADFLHDTKTGGNDSNYFYQVGAYVLGLEAEGENVKGAQIDWLKRTPLNAKNGPAEPKVETYDPMDAAKGAFALAHRFKRDLQLFLKTGNEWSFYAHPCPMLCKEKYCDAHTSNYCTVWRKNK